MCGLTLMDDFLTQLVILEIFKPALLDVLLEILDLLIGVFELLMQGDVVIVLLDIFTVG
jgi:hypothetical protein